MRAFDATSSQTQYNHPSSLPIYSARFRQAQSHAATAPVNSYSRQRKALNTRIGPALISSVESKEIDRAHMVCLGQTTSRGLLSFQCLKTKGRIMDDRSTAVVLAVSGFGATLSQWLESPKLAPLLSLAAAILWTVGQRYLAKIRGQSVDGAALAVANPYLALPPIACPQCGTVSHVFAQADTTAQRAALNAIAPPAPPPAHTGFVQASTLRQIVLAFFVSWALMLAASFFLHGCGPQQHPRPWDENARATVNGATHLLRDIDEAAATRYRQLAPDASNITTFDAPYNALLEREHQARDSLIEAQSAIDLAVRTQSVPDRCRAGTLVANSHTVTANALQLASDFGLPITGENLSTVAALEQLAQQLVPSCSDGGA